MTTNEKQELNVLSIFVDNKIDKFSSMKFPKEITCLSPLNSWRYF